VQQPTFAPEPSFDVRGSRRNGIECLFLVGDLDVGSAPALQRELDAVAHPGCALVLDLGALESIDRFGLHALGRAAEHAGREAWRLCIVNASAAVRHAFDVAGAEHLLSGTDVSDLLDTDDAHWSPMSLPPLPGQRARRRSRNGRR
jgi:anti-anti-sigma factor